MRNTLLALLVAAALSPLLRATPTYDPNPRSAHEPSLLECMALQHVLRYPGDTAFVQAHLLPGQVVKDPSGISPGQVADVERLALQYAHLLMAGGEDFPVSVPVNLLKYDMSSEAFATDCPSNVHSVDGLFAAEPSRSDKDAPAYSQMNTVNLSDWTNFAGLHAAKADAKALLLLMGKPTTSPGLGTLLLKANCRMLPGSFSVKTQLGQPPIESMDAEIISYSVTLADGTPLPPSLASAIQFVRSPLTP